MAKRIGLITLYLFVCLGFAVSVPLTDLADELELTLIWDPYGQVGRLSRGSDEMVIKVDADMAVQNYNQVVSVDRIERRIDGCVWVPSSTEAIIRTFFPPRKVDPNRLRIAAVILDPGHGGRDVGAIGRLDGKKLYEKNVALETSRKIYGRLRRAYPDKKIILTRDDDTYLELEQRTELANSIDLKENEAMLFVSVHANASLNAKAKGFEVWYLPPEYRRTLVTADMVKKEERSILPILNELMEEETSTESIILARSILDGLDQQIGEESPNRGLKEESWFVVRNARMPSVLIELGFITNPQEAVRLDSQDYLKKLSDGIYNGLQKFIADFESSNGFTE